MLIWALTTIGWLGACAIWFWAGISCGRRKEREKPRVLSASQVLADKLNLAYCESKNLGHERICQRIAEQGKRTNTEWAVIRTFVKTEGCE